MATDSAELRSAVSASQAARFGRDAGAASKRQAKGRERAELSAQLDHARGVAALVNVAWTPSRQSFSNRRRSSVTGTPHS